jgi:hypothetical protein
MGLIIRCKFTDNDYVDVLVVKEGSSQQSLISQIVKTCQDSQKTAKQPCFFAAGFSEGDLVEANVVNIAAAAFADAVGSNFPGNYQFRELSGGGRSELLTVDVKFREEDETSGGDDNEGNDAVSVAAG